MECVCLNMLLKIKGPFRQLSEVFDCNDNCLLIYIFISFLYHFPSVYFSILDSLLSFYLGIDAAITSTSPLPPFVPEEQVESSSSEAIPSLYPISPTIDFLKTNNYNLKNSIGQKKAICEWFRHYHRCKIL